MKHSFFDDQNRLIELVGSSRGLQQVILQSSSAQVLRPPQDEGELYRESKKQILEFLRGQRRHFDLPLDYQAPSAFTSEVWEALREIPYGETINYGELARRIKRPKASRAVGGALGKNPLPLILPCHRVVAKQGIGGFTPSLTWKKYLLKLELN